MPLTGRKGCWSQNGECLSPTRSTHHSAAKSAARPGLGRSHDPVRSGAGSSPLAEFEGGQYDAAEGFDEKDMDTEMDLELDSDLDLDSDSESDLEPGLSSDSSDWKEAYDRPDLYDSAFSFRDFSEEVWGEMERDGQLCLVL